VLPQLLVLRLVLQLVQLLVVLATRMPQWTLLRHAA
jgi:hypothetical protein